MKTPRLWLRSKFAERCVCSSNRSYRECCYHREATYFLILVLSAFCLIAARESAAFLIALPILLSAALVTKSHYDRERRKSQKHDDLPTR
jgi:hypothetical protein